MSFQGLQAALAEAEDALIPDCSIDVILQLGLQRPRGLQAFN